MGWNPFRRRTRPDDSRNAVTASIPVQAPRPVAAPVPVTVRVPETIAIGSAGPAPRRSSADRGRPGPGPAPARRADIFEYRADGTPSRSSAVDIGLVDLSDEGRADVVGESHYQRALTLAAGGRVAGRAFDEHVPVTAVLVPESGNPFDARAVRVDVLRGKRVSAVGYLPRTVAPDYRPALLRLRDSGQAGTCPARICGGGPDRYYGIYLLLAPPERLLSPRRTGPDASFARVGTDRILFEAEWTCTVTREEDHQDILARHRANYADPQRPGEFVLDFCIAGKGKYRGERVVEVRIGTDRVGELTRAMTNRYAGLVETALDRGAVPSCYGHITPEASRGLQVTLHMPRDPSRSG